MFVGAIISVCMALFLPTIKVIVGLGIIEYETPEFALFLTYFGFFLVGVPLFISTLKKFRPNSKTYAFTFYIFAVFLGGVGRILTFVALIKMSIIKRQLVPSILLLLSLLLQLLMVFFGSGGPISTA